MSEINSNAAPEKTEGTPPSEVPRLLQGLKVQVEEVRVLNEKIENAKSQLAQRLEEAFLIHFKTSSPEDSKPKYEIYIDHYILGLGYERLEKLVSNQPIDIQQQGGHPGDVEYSFLRTGFPRNQRLHFQREGETAENFIYAPLHNIAPFDNSWIFLIALDAIKRNQNIRLQDEEGKQISLSTIYQRILKEADQTEYNLGKREPITERDIFAKALLSFWWGLDRWFHNVHCFVAYAVAYQSIDQLRNNEYLQIIFNQIHLNIPEIRSAIQNKSPSIVGESWENGRRIQTFSDIHDDTGKRINFMAHLLTPLTELPENFPFSTHEKENIKELTTLLLEDISSLTAVNMQDSWDSGQSELVVRERRAVRRETLWE